jgi:hypothetical protein
MTRIGLVLALCISFLLSGCGPQCTQTGYIELTEDIEARWLDAVDLASNTSRMSLSGPLSEMQAILREYKSLEVPECYEEIHEKFIESYEYTIDGFLAFLAQESDEQVSRLFRYSDTSFEDAMRLLVELPG